MQKAFGTVLIREGIVLLEHGPVTMVLEACQGDKPRTDVAKRAARRVITLFEELARELETAKRAVSHLEKSLEQVHSKVLRKMIGSVRRLGEPDFTPMAAVAGSLADFAVEEMVQAGADYATANNGGDIAFHLSPAKMEFNIGIISDLSQGRITHRLRIGRESGIGGLATSGFGGRSLTRGIASAVTVMAETASLADAAATSVANACDAEDPQVERCLAEELDYDTDIRGLTVTRTIGKLRDENVRIALASGSSRAAELCGSGMIKGAVLFVSGRMEIQWSESVPLFSVSECIP
jgi:ApbE superfamily uncharacterized protein (UPF0280 family)